MLRGGLMVACCGALACSPSMNGEEACMRDRLECTSGPALQPSGPCLPRSELQFSGPCMTASMTAPVLRAALGSGDEAFLRLLPRQELPVFEPPRQPAYLMLGVRVDCIDPDNRAVQLDVTLEEFDTKVARWMEVARREVVYDDALLEGEGQRAEAIELVMVPSRWDPGRDRRVDVEVETACGAVTDLRHELPAAD